MKQKTISVVAQFSRFSQYKTHLAALLGALSLFSGLLLSPVDPLDDPDTEASGRKSRSGRWTSIVEPLVLENTVTIGL